MGSRLTKSIKTYSGLEFQEIVQVIDSVCTLAVLQNETEWMANRAAEILSVTDVKDVYHVKSELNIADLATRTGATVQDIAPGSSWQIGTDWMRLDKNLWPLTQNTKGTAIPEEETKKVALVAATTSNAQPYIDINRFRGRRYVLLVRTIAHLFQICHSRSLKAVFECINYKQIKLAEQAIIKMSMVLTKRDFEAGKFKSLGAMMNEQGIICVKSRVDNAMKEYYGCDEFPILTYKDPLSQI